MNIALFTDTYTPEINGVVASVLMLREGLEDLGHTVFVFAPAHPEAPEDERNVIRIPSLPLIVLPERRVATPIDLGMLRHIGSLNLDIIHTHTEFGVSSYGFRAARKFGIPHIHTYHTVWEEYTHYLSPRAFDAQARTVVRKATELTCRRCDHIVAPTEKTRALLAGYGITKPICVVPTGVDLSRFSPPSPADEGRLEALRTQYDLDKFEHIILSVGRVAPEKGVVELMLLVAPHLKAHPDTCFLIVGGGPSLKELKKLAHSLGIEDQAVFTGEVVWEHVPDFYRISDVLVGNSSTETQGLTFIEAIASAVPIVVRYNECFDGIIENGVSGSLFTDENQFEEYLNNALDPAQRVLRIQQGLEAANHVSKEMFAEKIEAVYLTELRDFTVDQSE